MCFNWSLTVHLLERVLDLVEPMLAILVWLLQNLNLKISLNFQTILNQLIYFDSSVSAWYQMFRIYHYSTPKWHLNSPGQNWRFSRDDSGQPVLTPVPGTRPGYPDEARNSETWKRMIKCGASSRLSSSLYFPKRNSDQMIIEKTRPTLSLV